MRRLALLAPVLSAPAALALLPPPLVLWAAPPAAGQAFTKITTGDIVSDLRYSEGALFEDVDGDEDLDLFVANIVDQDNLFYRNDGAGGFTEETAGPEVTDGGFSYGGCFQDLDDDGDPDLFVVNGGSSQTVTNFYYRNDGGTFSKVTTGDLVTDAGGSWSSSTSDWDLDGDLDVFVANYNQNNAMYRNDGGGTFTKIIAGPVVTDGGASLGSAWGDYDDDGDQDLFVANADFGAGVANFLYRNDGGGAFTRILTGQVATDTRNSVGGSWGDADNDGDLDLLVANYSNFNNHFYRNDGGTLVRVTQAAGLNHGGSSVCGAWGDWNNDGDLDLFVSNDLNGDNLLYENDGDGTFTRILVGDIVNDGGRSNGSAWADIDRDGDLDLFVTNGDQPTAQSNFLYRNDGAGGSNHWLNVRCIGVQSNRSAIGARVRAKATIGGQPVWQMREISGQTGYNAQNSLEVEIGLGDATVVDSLVIEWPLGQVDVYENVPVDRFLRLVEGVDPTGASARPGTPVAALGQNVPNPFDSRTEIPFALPREAFVTVDVYDVTGRRVRSLVEGVRPPGRHRAVLDAQGLPSGALYYVLRVEGREHTRRMVIVR